MQGKRCPAHTCQQQGARRGALGAVSTPSQLAHFASVACMERGNPACACTWRPADMPGGSARAAVCGRPHALARAIGEEAGGHVHAHPRAEACLAHGLDVLAPDHLSTVKGHPHAEHDRTTWHGLGSRRWNRLEYGTPFLMLLLRPMLQPPIAAVTAEPRTARHDTPAHVPCMRPHLPTAPRRQRPGVTARPTRCPRRTTRVSTADARSHGIARGRQGAHGLAAQAVGPVARVFLHAQVHRIVRARRGPAEAAAATDASHDVVGERAHRRREHQRARYVAHQGQFAARRASRPKVLRVEQEQTRARCAPERQAMQAADLFHSVVGERAGRWRVSQQACELPGMCSSLCFTAAAVKGNLFNSPDFPGRNV